VAIETSKKEGQESTVAGVGAVLGKLFGSADGSDGRELLWMSLEDFVGKIVETGFRRMRTRLLFLMYTANNWQPGCPAPYRLISGVWRRELQNIIMTIHPGDVFGAWRTSVVSRDIPTLCRAAGTGCNQRLSMRLPQFPDAGRRRFAVNVLTSYFHTSPTAIPNLRKAGP